MTLLNQYKISIYSFIFLLGLISSFSLPPYDFFYLNFLSYPALLWILLLNSKDKIRSFNIGWIFGFGYFISNLYWITNSLTFEDIFKPLIPFALILIPLFLGLFYGLSTLFFSLIGPKKNFVSILIISTILSVIEYIRSFILGGFPWNLIAFSFVNYLEFIQILSLLGTYAFNSLVIILFFLPVILFFDYHFKKKIKILFFALLIISSNYIWGHLIIEQHKKTENRSLEFTIKVISPKIDINRYFQNENPLKLIKELINISEPDPSKETIFVFPEGILSSMYIGDLNNFQHEFSKIFSDKHKIILGMNTYEENKIYNSLLVLDNELNLLSKYNKNKLVPFGEFVPFENALNKIGLKKITIGYHSFSSDNIREVIKLNNLLFLPLICYEIIYSGKISNSNNYDFILNISEDGWFGDSIGPYQHFSHSIFRSIEEGKHTIRSTNNGISAFINPKGQIISKVSTTNKGFIELDVFKKSNKTIFSGEGNKIFFYFVIIYISLIFFLKIRGN